MSEYRVDHARKRVDIFIDFQKGARFPCPECKDPANCTTPARSTGDI